MNKLKLGKAQKLKPACVGCDRVKCACGKKKKPKEQKYEVKIFNRESGNLIFHFDCPNFQVEASNFQTKTKSNMNFNFPLARLILGRGEK